MLCRSRVHSSFIYVDVGYPGRVASRDNIIIRCWSYTRRGHRALSQRPRDRMDGCVLRPLLDCSDLVAAKRNPHVSGDRMVYLGNDVDELLFLLPFLRLLFSCRSVNSRDFARQAMSFDAKRELRQSSNYPSISLFSANQPRENDERTRERLHDAARIT